RYVDKVHQKSSSLHMSQKVAPETYALRGALYETGYVGTYERRALSDKHQDEIGGEGCKMIVGAFGSRRGYHGQKGGLSHIGKTYKSHICDEFELKKYLSFVALKSRLGKTGSLSCGCGKVGIAPAASAALGGYKSFGARHIT